MTKQDDGNVEFIHLLEKDILKFLVRLDEIHSANLIKPGERIVIEGNLIKLVSSH